MDLKKIGLFAGGCVFDKCSKFRYNTFFHCRPLYFYCCNPGRCWEFGTKKYHHMPWDLKKSYICIR